LSEIRYIPSKKEKKPGFYRRERRKQRVNRRAQREGRWDGKTSNFERDDPSLFETWLVDGC